MSVNAQLAQKSKFYIAGTAGAAKTITAVAVGFPTVITSTAHGLANGDVVTFASIVGTVGTDTTAGLNGKALVIKYVKANTFAVDIDTTGLTYTSGGTGTASAWTQIKEIKGIKPGGASASTIDVTDLDSDAKEYRSGLMDNGSLGIDVFILESDPGQAACLAAFTNATANNYKVVSQANKTRTFNATLTKWPTIPDSSVDGVLTGSAEWRVSGAVTVS